MLRDIGEELSNDHTLGEAIEKREAMRRQAKADLMDKPEFCEVLDRDGHVIFGMKRDRVVRNRRIIQPPKRNHGLLSFLDEVDESRDTTLQGMFEEAMADLDPHREDSEVQELIAVLETMIGEYDVALGYVRAAGATVHADMGSNLLARARQALEPFK